MPGRPDTASLDDIRLTAGNEQLLALYNWRDELGGSIDRWTDLAERIVTRWPNWSDLKRLVAHVSGLQDAEVILAQVKTIEQQRQLLEEPDPVGPLIAGLTQLLRDKLNKLDGQYATSHAEGHKRLAEDRNWQQLEQEQRSQLLLDNSLNESARPKVEVRSTRDVLATLDNCALSMFAERVAALPTHFNEVLLGAAKLMEPGVQVVSLPRRTLKTDEEIDAWVNEVQQRLKAALKQGPLVIG